MNNTENAPDIRISNFENEIEKIEEINAENLEVITEFTNVSDFYKNIKKNRNMSRYPKLTKYEKTRVISIRAQQIVEGALPLVNVKNLRDPIEIALKELAERRISLLIERKMPDGSSYIISVNELGF